MPGKNLEERRICWSVETNETKYFFVILNNYEKTEWLCKILPVGLQNQNKNKFLVPKDTEYSLLGWILEICE